MKSDAVARDIRRVAWKVDILVRRRGEEVDGVMTACEGSCAKRGDEKKERVREWSNGERR